MRLMTKTLIVFLCVLCGTGCQEHSLDSRMKRVEEKAESTYFRLQIESRTEHDLRTLFGKTDADLETIGIHHPAVLRTLYQSRAYRVVWINGNSLSDNGAVVSRLSDAAVLSHGVDPKRVHQKRRTELLRSTGKDPYALDFTDDEKASLRKILERQPPARDLDFATSVAGPKSPFLRIRESLQFTESRMSERSRLEILTADAAIEFGMQMRWSHDVWIKNYPWPDHLKPKTDENGDLDITRQMRQKRRNHVAILGMTEALASAEFERVLSGLIPTYEQYGRLQKAYRNYRTIVAKGGWDPLPKSAVRLSIGDVDPGVRTLKRRLAAEGFWKGDDGPFFTEPLREALKIYQKTHQLWEKGTISRETLLSLNVSAEKRLSQIRVSLDRWRDSNIGADAYFVFVNVPDFHLEVWKGGVREQRFRTVVGATDVTTDPESNERSHGFATPRLSSKIHSIIWDPYWWVPPGIESEELVPRMLDDPELMERMGYEWAINHQGENVLRQVPSDRNALGRVKLMFDNPHFIYMHDTPDRQIFGWPVRAESHGCIRLERAVDLSRALLANEAKWKADFEHRTSGERVVNLSKPVPVHIEYYVVRVDDLGRVNFLADLYRLNHRRYEQAAQMEIGKAIPASVIDP